MTDEKKRDETLDEFLGVKPANPWLRRGKWIGVALLALLFLLLLYRCFGPGDAVRYSTGEVSKGALTVTVSATGNIKPINQVDVGSEQSGLITNVYVDVNDRVTKGQLLATLDPARLQDSVVQAEASLAAAEANVGEAQATLALSNATLARQEEVFRLSGGRVPSKTELDAARADQKRATASLAASRAQVSQQRAALGTAQTNLSKARIYSPVTGVVLSRDIEPGQTVAASLNAPVLFTIAEDLSQMELEVSIDEADVGQVKEGQDATFTVDAFPGERFPAKIKRVNVGSNNSGNSSSSSSSSTASSASAGTVVAYTAILSVDNAKQQLRPGMTATADIVTMHKQNALLIPNAALRYRPAQAGAAASSGGITGALVPRRPRRGGDRPERTVTSDRGAQQTVYILGGEGQPQAVQVTTGETNGSVTEVTSGSLRAGSKVITGQLSDDTSAAAAGSGGAGGGAGGGGGGGRRGGGGGG
ncbi:HlyD family secretion protein [Sphingopyxis panaciterrae]|uniref:efflux RND transporter periplasmic adaptor subunit n=1 Tax=Sphingopyxis panaciterrae TaxID=363841 RepID=UPI00141F1298|nr:efflux RND transporter periplasmic adaptor subunit [Sphingopyxis panaciterrae]NIJ36215.1 HlyD family secretion protein [Sphingopyxis panaciterrae]